MVVTLILAFFGIIVIGWIIGAAIFSYDMYNRAKDSVRK